MTVLLRPRLHTTKDFDLAVVPAERGFAKLLTRLSTEDLDRMRNVVTRKREMIDAELTLRRCPTRRQP